MRALGKCKSRVHRSASLMLAGLSLAMVSPPSVNSPLPLSTVAQYLGVSDEQVDKLSGLRAVHADTWVFAIATLKAPWAGQPVSFDYAMRWVQTAQGHQRGWNICFEDGSKLACTRRYDPTALASFAPAGSPAASCPSLKVVIGDETIDGGFEVRQPSTDGELNA